MYKRTDNGVVRLADGANIPADPANRDYAEYLEWVAAGGTPQPQYTLAERKFAQATRITQSRNAALQGLTAIFDSDTWDADEGTSARIANALTMIQQAQTIGIPTPIAIAWRTYDNKDRMLTIAELISMGATVFLAQQTVWGKQAALKNQIAAATNPAEVDAVTW